MGRDQMKHLAAAALALLLALPGAPALAEKPGTTLRLIAQADLRVLDPIWTTAVITRNYGYMVYDTLFALDSHFKPHPQMVDRWTVSADQLTYTFTLRPGLKFDDGQPVTSADCIASLERWSKRDALGQTVASVVAEYRKIDDTSFSIVLKKPFPLLLAALAKPDSNVPFIMPQSVAETSANQQIKSTIGSGPFKFVNSEWQPGHRVVFVKNPEYVPRKEPASWASGGKIVNVDRVEWLYIPDQTTALAAFTAGEADWWENPPPDFYRLLDRDPNVTLIQGSPFGVGGLLRFNQLQPPFDNPQMRQALLYAVDQADYMSAVAGDRKYWSTCYSFYTLRRADGEQRRGQAARRAARPGQGQGADQRSRIPRRRGRAARSDRLCQPARAGAGYRRPLAPARHQCRGAVDGLGHPPCPPRLQGADRARRLEHLSDDLSRHRDPRPVGQRTAARQRRIGVGRLADRSDH